MCAYMFLNILIKFQSALKFLSSTKNLFASSAKLLIADIPCRCSIESSLWATKRSLGRVTDGEKSGCQYYWNGGCRLREQSAISASQSGALIGTAWYRIKLKGKLRVIAREREKGGKERMGWDAHGSALRVHKSVCGHPGTLNYDPIARETRPFPVLMCARVSERR